jgi:hypothetical protein
MMEITTSNSINVNPLFRGINCALSHCRFNDL